MKSIVRLEPGEAEAHAIRVNKLELVERLADDLAHEIKNPLHSMVINLEVLRRRIARAENGGPDELLRYVQIIGGELDRVHRRVDLLLRLVRPDRESSQPTTAAEVLEELQEVLQVESDRREVSLRIEAHTMIDDPRLPRAATRQAVLNLVLYALDHAPPGGTLHVTLRPESGWTHLLLHLENPDGTPARADKAGPGLEVARALAVALGGRLETPAPEGVDSAPAFALALPRG